MKDQATINARLSASLKKRGDEVLKKSGVSPTQAIRALWGEMARTRMVPDFVLQEAQQGDYAERQKKVAALRGLDNLTIGASQHALDNENCSVAPEEARTPEVRQ